MIYERTRKKVYNTTNKNYIFLLVEITLFFVCLFYYINIDKTNVTFNNLNTLVIFDFILFVILFLYCISGHNIQKNIGLLCFSIAFFVLIMGQYFLALFDSTIYGKYIFTTVSTISLKNELTGLFVIFISLLCVSIGYIVGKDSERPLFTEKKKALDLKNDIYSRYSLYIMYIGAVASFIKLFAKIYYSQMNGYLSIYLNTGSALFTNPLLDMFDGFYMIGFIGLLASFPSRDKLKKPIMLYVLYTILSLFTGQRGDLVINIIFMMWYLSKYADIHSEKPFLTRKKIILIGALSIFLISFLYTWGYSRVGVSVASESIDQKIRNFIYGQGGSGHLISLSLENIDSMEQYISKPSMILWPVENFIVNNSVVRLFTGGALGQSAGNIGSFGGALTYITNRASFLNGSSVGTCYLAELFCSCGFIGIIIFNLILGKFIKKMDFIKPNNWKSNTLFIKIFLIIVYIPRQATLQFIPESVITIIFILIVSWLYNGKRGQRIETK